MAKNNRMVVNFEESTELACEPNFGFATRFVPGAKDIGLAAYSVLNRAIRTKMKHEQTRIIEEITIYTNEKYTEELKAMILRRAQQEYESCQKIPILNEIKVRFVFNKDKALPYMPDDFIPNASQVLISAINSTMEENEPDIMIDEVTIYIDERFTEKIKTEILELAQYEYEDCYQMYGWD